MGRRWVSGLGLAAVSVAVSACGGSGLHGEAHKSPEQIQADTVAALRGLHSFRVAGNVVDAKGAAQISAEIAAPGKALLVERRTSSTLEVITLGPETYLNASRSYWAAQQNLTPTQVAVFANRWLKLPTSSNPNLETGIRRITNPKVMATCLAARKEALRNAGTGTVNGRPAVIVANSGSGPGTAPGKVYVAATGPAWPLRAIVTGPRKPGGPAGCQTSGNTQTASDFIFSSFNQPINIAAPAGALDLATLGRSASSA
jgi:hypothetical protein